ncbi:cysteine-rich receptor-like protein kinase 44 [Aegilops tauschii subsp. strangulata]|uniref:Cysteine-rich receptor-like protein kinase 41 n=1 Tax=Aegilops tauschii TaxID=37682 RepID=M8BPH9_AEGTA
MVMGLLSPRGSQITTTTVADESRGLDWHTRFKIINGVCLGLNYLHNGCKNPIYHLDLKPANILLDKNMVPKIGDFGLSRLFPSAQTYITNKNIGTLGYMPPEYIDRNEITSKYDVFSLGVIMIRIIAGDEGHSKYTDMSSQEFLEHVHENWTKRMQATMLSHISDQIKRCIKRALRCVDFDRKKRPTIAEIVSELNKVSDFQSKPALNQNTQPGRHEEIAIEGQLYHMSRMPKQNAPAAIPRLVHSRRGPSHRWRVVPRGTTKPGKDILLYIGVGYTGCAT